MGLLDGLRGFVNGLRKGPMIPVSDVMSAVGSAGIQVANPNNAIAVTAPVGEVSVVNTMRLPVSTNVPATWSQVFMGPGAPFVATTTRSEDAENEPRTMQYLPNVNATIAPRLAWGLTPFSELRSYAESVPEAAGAVRLITEEIKSFVPSLVDKADKQVDAPNYQWMIERPDLINPWPVWISRFVYNMMVYDAVGVYKMRPAWAHLAGKVDLITDIFGGDKPSSAHYEWKCPDCQSVNQVPLHKSDYQPAETQVCGYCERPAPELVKDAFAGEYSAANYTPVHGLRIIDGSTLFCLIDERGEQPEPPAPAFTQVIWGVPRMYLNTYQVWYHPRHLRADAPYGRSFIEDAMPAVRLLQSLWDYEYSKYATGNVSDMVFTVPQEFGTPDQIIEYESAFNARMVGNTKERAGRARFLPYGMNPVQTTPITFNRESYDAATNALRMAAGIPKSEAGEAPEGMLGGKGYAEAMQSSFYRMGIAPVQAYIEGLFNDILKECGETEIQFKLKFPSDSMDPEKEESKWQGRFMNGIATRDEARQGINMKPMGGENGEFIVTPGKGGEGDGQAGPEGMGGLGELASGGPQIPVTPGLGTVPVKGPMIAVKMNGNGLSKAADSTGIMVALPIPGDVIEQLRKNVQLPAGSDITPDNDFHLTLAILGEAGDDAPALQLVDAVAQFASKEGAIDGKINGYGRFIDTHLEGKHCIYANYDAPGLPEFRARLVEYLTGIGYAPKGDHGFTPHITLAYIPEDAPDITLNDPEVIPFVADTLLTAWGPKHYYTPLGKVNKYEPGEVAQAEGVTVPEGFDPDEYMMGMEVEREHDDVTGGDPEKIREIVEAHLQEVPDYYTRLKAVEKIAGMVDLAKHCGTCAEDDEYYGAEVKEAVGVPMPHQGANVTRIVSIGGEGQEPRPAVLKPATGEKEDLRDWVGGDLYRRAEAAYLLDRELAVYDGVYLVPVTYMVEDNGTPASVQHYVRERKPWKPVDQYGPEWVERAAVFDYISGQVDRHNKNWLTHPDDERRPVLIDNDLSFPVSQDQRLHSDFVDAMRGSPLTQSTLEQVYLVVGNKSLWQDLEEVLESPEAVKYARERAEAVVASGRIPAVGEVKNEESN